MKTQQSIYRPLICWPEKTKLPKRNKHQPAYQGAIMQGGTLKVGKLKIG